MFFVYFFQKKEPTTYHYAIGSHILHYTNNYQPIVIDSNFNFVARLSQN